MAAATTQTKSTKAVSKKRPVMTKGKSAWSLNAPFTKFLRTIGVNKQVYFNDELSSYRIGRTIVKASALSTGVALMQNLVKAGKRIH